MSPIVLQLEGVLAPRQFVAEVVNPFAALRGRSAEGVDRVEHELATWREAFSSGAFTLACPRDVWRNLKRWRTAGRPMMAIGDVSARHLAILLAHTPHGDATAFLERLIGPEDGDPTDPATWAKIGPQGALVSDREAALAAAASAGWTPVLLRRTDPGASLDQVLR